MIKKTCLVLAAAMLSNVALAADGIVSIESPYSVKETADRFESILNNKGLTVFTRINHSQNAAKVELELAPTEVVIFGNPKVGTPLMQCGSTAAIDLPQKALFWQDDQGKVWLSYNDPAYLKSRHQLRDCDAVIEKVSGVLGKLSKAATSR
ncbi:DUF302 domain-containing protein [Motiliproteus coralliicola]|uniref:DUF302 domain-containing protein n=1 Tax=Motiliproteus coralliicola TaxID=2283196 RepID=A0A369WUL3_9GAMM|nr:DUF302 domain-containing protein [Motiliproteus coralliicola]RDE25337.1 DUF302 domain-containing protein [Motiliproteus coralliicola]